ncbi:MAG TPA: hypothetical protein VGQ88_06720, partial [Burkholderiales bacterium]|nr:hypothetical protein [Burkholderiales bacterium]
MEKIGLTGKPAVRYHSRVLTTITYQPMQSYCRNLLITFVLVLYSHSLSAADNAPAAPAALSTVIPDNPPLGAWPISPPSRPFDRELGPEDIPTVQVPAAGAESQLPAMMDLTTAPISLWTRIRLGFGLPDVASPLVREQEEWFANRPDYIKRTVARSSRYL